MAKHEETTMDTELKTRIEAYVLQHAETLNTPLDTLDWEALCAPAPDSDAYAASPSYKIQVSIHGEPHFLTFNSRGVSPLRAS